MKCSQRVIIIYVRNRGYGEERKEEQCKHHERVLTVLGILRKDVRTQDKPYMFPMHGSILKYILSHHHRDRRSHHRHEPRFVIRKVNFHAFWDIYTTSILCMNKMSVRMPS